MKRVIAGILIFWWAIAAYAAKHVDNYLSDLCTPAFIESYFPEPGKWTPVPRYGDRYWRDSIPDQMRRSYIANGERFLKSDWPRIDNDLFADYSRTGVRYRYENFIFAKHGMLSSLAMAELMEAKGRFIPQIVRGLESLCDETWWGIPANYKQSVPSESNQMLDLFNAETGAIVAWTYYLFHDELCRNHPALADRIPAELARRIIFPALSSHDWWLAHTSNWNPWICSNWLAVELISGDNRERQIESIRKIAASLDGFIDKYPSDGGCNEGAFYWDRAGGSLLDCLAMLKDASGGRIDLTEDQKVVKIADFIVKMDIDGHHFIDFADADPTITIRPEWFPGAEAVGSLALMGLCADAAINSGFFTDPAKLFCDDNMPPLGRELILLSRLSQLEATNPRSSFMLDYWLPDTQIMAARSKANSVTGLYFAAKGGNNAENHNHNDVGSFIIYANGTPILLDPGRGIYDEKSFGADRYSLWYTRSANHNLPIINGFEQSAGINFKATDVKQNIGKKKINFSLNIAEAYPTEAAIDSWVRKFEFNRGKSLSITEDYKLARYIAPSEIILITNIKPELQPGRIILDSNGSRHHIEYNPKQLEVSYEQSADIDSALKKKWGEIYRITMRIRSSATIGHISYKIR